MQIQTTREPVSDAKTKAVLDMQLEDVEEGDEDQKAMYATWKTNKSAMRQQLNRQQLE